MSEEIKLYHQVMEMLKQAGVQPDAQINTHLARIVAATADLRDDLEALGCKVSIGISVNLKVEDTNDQQ